MELKRVGVDLAKRAFQNHGVEAGEKATVGKTLGRSQMRRFFSNLQPTLVGMEVCGSAHYWARELAAIRCERTTIMARGMQTPPGEAGYTVAVNSN